MTGGWKTPTIPLLAEQREVVLPSTVTRRIPDFLGFTVNRAMPCPFVRLVAAMPGAVTRTRALAIGLPSEPLTRATMIARLPTVSCRGVIDSDEQTVGGVTTPTTNVGASARLFAVFDSGC